MSESAPDRILIVDDDAPLRRSLGRATRRPGSARRSRRCSRTTPRSPLQRRRATAEAFDSTLRIIGWLNGLLLVCLGVVFGIDGASEMWRVLLGTVGALIGAAVGYAQYQILAALGFVCLNVVEWREL